MLLRLASVRLTNIRGGREAKLTIKRVLKLKDTAATADRDATGPNTSNTHANGSFIPPQAQRADHQPQFDPVDLTGLQAYLEAQRADINRIDSAGYQIVAAFDSAMDHVEREVKKLQDTMNTLRRELDGNRDDVSSLKTDVDSMRKDTRIASDEARALGSKLQDLRQRVPNSDTVDKLRDALAGLRRSSLDRASDANELRRELSLRKTEIQRMKDDQEALKSQVDELKKTPKEAPTPEDYAREVAALRAEVRQLRQDAAQKTSSHNQTQNSSFSSKELDILTRNITKIGNRASQIETLQMEFQLFKSRMHRLEAAGPPQRDEYGLPPFSDDEHEQGNGSTKAPVHRQKRPPASKGRAGEDGTSNKRLAFSSDAEEGPDLGTVDLPETPALDAFARGRGARRGRGSAQSARSGVAGRRVRGRGRKSFPVEEEIM